MKIIHEKDSNRKDLSDCNLTRKVTPFVSRISMRRAHHIEDTISRTSEDLIPIASEERFHLARGELFPILPYLRDAINKPFLRMKAMKGTECAAKRSLFDKKFA